MDATGGSGRRGGGLQVCLESQTVLHFPSVSLQLSLVNERGGLARHQRVRKHTHTHLNSPNVPNGFRVNLGVGEGDIRG